MIRRHPHVFGSEAERAAGAAPGFWERIKAEERAPNADAIPRGEGQGGGMQLQGSPTPNPPHKGEGTVRVWRCPVALPALTRAVKLQDKAARVGFDWPSLAPVFDKLKEELAELEQAIAAGSRRRQQTPTGRRSARSSATCCSWWPTSPGT